MGEHRFTSSSTTALCQLLSHTETLSSIHLSGVVSSSNETQNKKDRLSLEAVTAAHLFNPHLDRVALSVPLNALDATFGRKLAAMARDSRSLVKLNVSDCNLNDETLAILFQALTESSRNCVRNFSLFWTILFLVLNEL
jgi:hypothetical protein